MEELGKKGTGNEWIECSSSFLARSLCNSQLAHSVGSNRGKGEVKDSDEKEETKKLCDRTPLATKEKKSCLAPRRPLTWPVVGISDVVVRRCRLFADGLVQELVEQRHSSLFLFYLRCRGWILVWQFRLLENDDE